jgi:CRISPR system Cascade subunit CasA
MSESDAFNLINAAWLPVRRRSGGVERIQPWRVTEGMAEDPFVAFAWPRPDFNGAAHEFLIGLLSTAAAPEDDDEWEEWWQRPPAPEMLEERFVRLVHAFDLDGPGPRFLQDLDPLEDAEAKEIAALLIDAPGAKTLLDNADLFVKRGGVLALSRAAAAMALFTLSAYAPLGGAGHLTSLRGGGPMTTLIVQDHETHGATLWGRIWPNVESERQISGRAVEARERADLGSIFPWLKPTRGSNPKEGGRATTPANVDPLQVYWGMPRRLRLLFENAGSHPCSLTDSEDSVIVTGYRTRTYGTKYSEGFEHPLSPYYRQKEGAAKLPVHPRPGGVSYRLWPGLVIPSSDKLRDPAQVLRHWPGRDTRRGQTRFTVFGYDMDNMKARAWIESEMPFWLLSDATAREWLEHFIAGATAGADKVCRLLTDAVKSALCHRSSGPRGDYGFIAERFYRETEGIFYEAMRNAVASIRNNPDVDDPTIQARKNWAPAMAEAALRLFDEYAPADGLEDRDMRRHVKARFSLALALGGRGKSGRALFEGALGLASPESARARKNEKENR